MLIRAISALLGVAGLVLTWHFFQVKGIIVVSSLVSLVACFEFSMMVEKRSNVIRLLFICLAFSFHLYFSFVSQSFIAFMSLFIFLSSYFILFVNDSIETRISKLTSWTVGALYCGGFTGVVTLGVSRFGGQFFTALLMLSFLTDTFAYLGGRAFGRTPLSPQISPKKTLEGSLAGLVGGGGAGIWFLQSLESTSPLMVIIITCVAASFFSQVGDLFESTLKRFSGVKDSGKILPGHGGVLDRIDGLLFAGPIVFLWMQSYT